MAGALTEREVRHAVPEPLCGDHRGDFPGQVLSWTAGGSVRARGYRQVRIPTEYPAAQESGRRSVQFRYRTALPSSILAEAPAGETWIIRPAGRSRYQFVLVADRPLIPNPNLAVTKIPDATPGIIAKYAFNDEQAVLARIRYNRLIDIFLGIACYSLQNHLRTTVPGMGQVETCSSSLNKRMRISAWFRRSIISWYRQTA